MVHQFKLGGYNIVLDICSGAVHVVDDVAYDIIEFFESKEKKELIATVFEAHKENGVSYADVESVYEQIAQLKASGQLFTPDTYEPMADKLKAKTSGVIKALCLHVA